MKTLVFDTETTGLVGNSLKSLDKQPKIIEFFGLSLNGASGIPYSSLFAPGGKLPDKISLITGITDQILEGAPAFADKAAEFKALIESHDEVVAHNAAFDQAMIDMEMRRCGHEVAWPRIICTVEASEFYKGYRMKLAELYEFFFGEKFGGAHRAENDVRALAKCFTEMRQRGDI
jgi:DNA polymerase III epsilon subunit-like protein